MVTIRSSLAAAPKLSGTATGVGLGTAQQSNAPRTSVNKDEASGRFVATVLAPGVGELAQWPLQRDILFSRGIADYFRSLQFQDVETA